MGCGRPVQVDPRRATRRGWGQIGSHEPTLEGSFRGNRLSRGHQEQLHTDQASSPSGVLAAQLYGGLHHLGGRREGGRAVAVVWRDAVAIAEPKPPEETANGGARQAQGRDDLTGPAALFPEPEHRLTDRDRDGTWHGQTSQKHYNKSNCPILYQCRDAIKPGVGISRSNLVSRDTSRPLTASERGCDPSRLPSASRPGWTRSAGPLERWEDSWSSPSGPPRWRSSRNCCQGRRSSDRPAACRRGR
jgi:hypothetical protein